MYLTQPNNNGHKWTIMEYRVMDMMANHNGKSRWQITMANKSRKLAITIVGHRDVFPPAILSSRTYGLKDEREKLERGLVGKYAGL